MEKPSEREKTASSLDSFSYLPSLKSSDRNVLSGRQDEILDNFGHQSIFVPDVGLTHQAFLAEEFLQLALDDAIDHVLRLALCQR